MATIRQLISTWIDRGDLPPDQVSQALVAVGLASSGRPWASFLDRALLWLGGLCLALGVLFLIAFNWSELGRLGRFALVEGALVAAVVVSLRMPQGLSRDVALVVAGLLLGGLLALFGQTYQTGADPWQLFALWAVLLVPWALASAGVVLWLLMLALVNLSVSLYFDAWWLSNQEWAGGRPLDWLLSALNLSAWAIAHGWAQRSGADVSPWPLRLVAVAGGVAVSWLALVWIVDGALNQLWPGLAWVAWLAVLVWCYRVRQPDLFMLAGGCLSVIVIVTAGLARALLDIDEPGIWLMLGLIVLLMVMAATAWLRRLQRELAQ